MARFRFSMIGTAQVPLLEVAARDLTELLESVDRSRFLEAQMVEIDGCGVSCGVIVATRRIQMISEEVF